jgi:hypothetical protein
MSTRLALATTGLVLALATPGAAKSRDAALRIEVGPIWNQQDAKGKCDKAARKAGGEWTGDWTTVVPGQSSVCMVKMTKSSGSSLRWPEPSRPAGGAKVDKLPSGKFSVEAGPIHAQIEAQMKCPRAVGAVGGKWTGEWWTTQIGRMSVCEFTR